MTSQVFTGLQSYWRRKTYQKLENSSYSSKKKLPVIILGESRHRCWKLKTVSRRVCRLRLKVVSPVKLFLRLRDAYVNAMLVLAGEKKSPTAPLTAAAAAKKKKKTNSVYQVFKISKSCTEFERRMMIHIYSHLVAPSY